MGTCYKLVPAHPRLATPHHKHSKPAKSHCWSTPSTACQAYRDSSSWRKTLTPSAPSCDLWLPFQCTWVLESCANAVKAALQRVCAGARRGCLPGPHVKLPAPTLEVRLAVFLRTRKWSWATPSCRSRHSLLTSHSGTSFPLKHCATVLPSLMQAESRMHLAMDLTTSRQAAGSAMMSRCKFRERTKHGTPRCTPHDEPREAWAMAES